MAHRPAASLLPGRYLYAGSARGPGGMRARLDRHLRRNKGRTGTSTRLRPWRGRVERGFSQMGTTAP
ncbi:MAG: DUF123 domain-containing protein [Rhodopila sp.]